MRTLYNILWYFLTPFMFPWLWWRLYKNKEEKGRLQERFGLYSTEKTDKPTIWLHGASVGETLSLRPIIAFLKENYPNHLLLVTTGTKTAANMIIQKEQGDIIHQYVPLDHPLWTKRFFDHWKPSLGILVESEFWPNLILNAPCPMWLLSARLTPGSYGRWKKWLPGFFGKIIGRFALIFAQTEADIERLKEFYREPIFISNLKYLAKPLPTEKTTVNALEKMIGSRPFWVVASTHPGEETIIIKAHKLIKERIPNILTILIPRHPVRGQEVKQMVTDADLSVVQRSTKEKITPKTDIYVADTMGELGNFFSISPITLVGGSLLPNIGGHNLLEPAFFGNGLLHGPHMHKSLDMYDLFTSAQASFVVKDEKDIANCVIVLLENKEKLAQQQTATREVMTKIQKDQRVFWKAFKVELESTLP
jgi:3-deoxy-D-manno-octulosonic-acid transferase